MTPVKEPEYGPRHFNDAILLPYQVRWNQEEADLAAAEKGRRIGLSWGEASEDALLAAKSPEDGGMDVWYMSYNKEMTEQFVGDVAFWAGIFGKVASDVEEGVEVFQDGDEMKSVTVFRVRFASGHKVTGLPSNPRILRSKQGKVVIDEAAFVDNLREVLKAALALTVWGAVVRVISTHNGEDNEFNQLVQDIRAGKRPGVVHRYPFMDAVEQGLYHKICRKQGRDWTPEGEAEFVEKTQAIYADDVDEELNCVPSKGGGTYLTRNLIESCMDPSIPVLRWSPPADDFVDWPLDRAAREVRDWCEAEIKPLLDALPKAVRSYFGEDFGRSGDLSVIWPLLELACLTLRTPFVVELRNAPYRTQEQILAYIVDRLPGLSGGALDARGNGQAQAEYARQRYGPELIAEVMLSEGWYREHMPKLKSQFEDRTILIPKDQPILDDLRAFKVNKGVARLPEGKTAKKGGQRHGDAGIAAAMAVFAAKTMEGGGPCEVSTGPPRQTKAMMAGYA